MTSTPDLPQPEADASGPYALLGVEADASFEQVQSAKQERLAEVADDPLARARIEAAYDAVLMERLKERQQGKVSTAARSASVREQQTAATKPAAAGPGMPALPKLASLARPVGLSKLNLGIPTLRLEQGRDSWITLAGAGVLAMLVLLLPSVSPELLLSLATLGAVTMLLRRNRRFWASVGWSFGLLVVGLVLGGLLTSVLSADLPLGLPLNASQVQSLPALVLLALGALLIV